MNREVVINLAYQQLGANGYGTKEALWYGSGGAVFNLHIPVDRVNGDDLIHSELFQIFWLPNPPIEEPESVMRLSDCYRLKYMPV